MNKAFEAAVLAPNSSNIQSWNFLWVTSPATKAKLIEYCFSQSAARKAAELVVITADPALWRRSQVGLVEYTKQVNAPKQVQMYYQKLVPIMYRWGFLNSLAPVKVLFTFFAGLFRPVPRGPHTKRGLQEVAVKSAALAAENFVLAMTAQGFSTCMMEGFDECRVKTLLKIPSSARVVMVIGAGKEMENGTWGPRYRMPTNLVVKKV